MTVLPLRLVGDAELTALQKASAKALAGWQHAFGAGDDHASAWAPLVLAPGAAATATRLCWRDGQRRLWIDFDGDGLDMLAVRLFAEPVSSHAMLARAMGAQALTALGAALAGALLPATAAFPRAGSAVSPEPRSIDAIDLRAGAGAACCQWHIGALVLRCTLSGEAVAALTPRIPPKALPALPSVALMHLLRDVPVRLTIEAGAAEVGAGSLLDCGPGDLVRLNTPISAPLKVLAPGGATLFHGFLGRVGEHSAVEVTQHF